MKQTFYRICCLLFFIGSNLLCHIQVKAKIAMRIPREKPAAVFDIQLGGSFYPTINFNMLSIVGNKLAAIDFAFSPTISMSFIRNRTDDFFIGAQTQIDVLDMGFSNTTKAFSTQRTAARLLIFGGMDLVKKNNITFSPIYGLDFRYIDFTTSANSNQQGETPFLLGNNNSVSSNLRYIIYPDNSRETITSIGFLPFGGYNLNWQINQKNNLEFEMRFGLGPSVVVPAGWIGVNSSPATYGIMISAGFSAKYRYSIKEQIDLIASCNLDNASVFFRDTSSNNYVNANYFSVNISGGLAIKF